MAYTLLVGDPVLGLGFLILNPLSQVLGPKFSSPSLQFQPTPPLDS